MHEEALLRDLSDQVEAVARAHGLVRVLRIRLWVGALSHLEEGQVRDRWAEVARGTRAGAAALEILRSSDLDDPRAQSVVLLDVVGDDGGPPPPG